jgi:glucokinase
MNVLAIDLGGTKTAIALVDETGHIADKEKLPAAASFEGTLEQMAPRLTTPVAAVGVIVPGIYDVRTGGVWAPNLWGPDFHPLREALRARVSVPVAIGSDRTGSAIAEQWVGAARGVSDIIFVAIGTGIGAGIIAGGRPIEGAHGIAGAVGWMTVGGRWTDAYRERGGWETEAAGPAIARRAGTPTASDAAAAARAGDANAADAYRVTAEHLGLGIANLIATLDPEMVVLGGGVMEAGDLLVDRIRAHALAWTQPIAATRVRIERTILGEDAGLLGAARLAWLDTRRAQP